MKIRLLLTLCLAMLAAACSPSGAPSPEPTAEVTAEVTVEVTAEMQSANSGWVTVTRASPEFPGWEYRHPEGWETVTLDDRNLFIYNNPEIGQRLFTIPLNPGEIAFQISFNRPSNPDETLEAHLTTFSGFLPNMVMSPPSTLTLNGAGAMSQRGQNDNLQLSTLVVSQPFVVGGFVDIIAYSRTDEIDANLPLLNAVIETVRYTLPTE